jgi:hypothetical protein
MRIVQQLVDVSVSWQYHRGIWKLATRKRPLELSLHSIFSLESWAHSRKIFNQLTISSMVGPSWSNTSVALIARRFIPNARLVARFTKQQAVQHASAKSTDEES